MAEKNITLADDVLALVKLRAAAEGVSADDLAASAGAGASEARKNRAGGLDRDPHRTSRVLYDKFAWHGNDVREALELILQFAACLRLDDTLDAVLRPQVSRSEEARGSL